MPPSEEKGRGGALRKVAEKLGAMFVCASLNVVLVLLIPLFKGAKPSWLPVPKSMVCYADIDAFGDLLPYTFAFLIASICVFEYFRVCSEESILVSISDKLLLGIILYAVWAFAVYFISDEQSCSIGEITLTIGVHMTPPFILGWFYARY